MRANIAEPCRPRIQNDRIYLMIRVVKYKLNQTYSLQEIKIDLDLIWYERLKRLYLRNNMATFIVILQKLFGLTW